MFQSWEIPFFIARREPMTETQNADGTIMIQKDDQTIVVELFFDHDSKETFQDKLLKVMAADRTA